MKAIQKVFLCMLLQLCLLPGLLAQVGINTDGSAADNSAMLDIKSPNTGLLIPRMTEEERDLIPSPAAGLMVFNLTTSMINYFSGNVWFRVEWEFAAWASGSDQPGGGVLISSSPGALLNDCAILDLEDNARGLLVPRTAPSSVPAPAPGLLIFNMGTGTLDYYNGSQWITLCSSSTGAFGNTGSQGVSGLSVNTDGSPPHHSAILDISSANRGLLLPRLSESQRSSLWPEWGLILYNTTSNKIEFANGNEWDQLRSTFVSVPNSGTHIAGQAFITWNWNAVAGAEGYKWNTVNDYASATDMGTTTSRTEAGLTCNTSYTRYAWAYTPCGHSDPVAMNQSTSTNCFPCGQNLAISHYAGPVAPVSKTVTYGTVNGIPGEPSKCWITQNLGADHQATGGGDNTEASAGWYWQFNRKQGYKNDGMTVTPAWTLTSISENSSWTAANDPCTIELGSPWRIPLYSEWFNINSAGGWTNWTGPWGSALKLHMAGLLHNLNGNLYNRGSIGYFWSGSQYYSNPSNAWYFAFDCCNSSFWANAKAWGYSLRCLLE